MAVWLSWLEHLMHGSVASLIPILATCLNFGFGPWLGQVQEAANQYISLTFVSLSPSLPVPFSLSLKINGDMSLGENQKRTSGISLHVNFFWTHFVSDFFCNIAIYLLYMNKTNLVFLLSYFMNNVFHWNIFPIFTIDFVENHVYENKTLIVLLRTKWLGQIFSCCLVTLCESQASPEQRLSSLYYYQKFVVQWCGQMAKLKPLNSFSLRSEPIKPKPLKVKVKYIKSIYYEASCKMVLSH